MAKKITKKINQQYLPTIVGGYSVYSNGGRIQYGLGSFLKNNWTGAMSPAIALGSLASGKDSNEFTQENAGIIGTVGGAAAGSLVGNPMMGAQIGGQLGNAVQSNYEQKQTNQTQQLQKQQGFNQGLINNLPGTNNYTPTFAMGGFPNMINPNSNIPTSNRLSEFKNGGTHEQSPLGGIPVGKDALTEEGEFMYTTKKGEKYIFTNRF